MRVLLLTIGAALAAIAPAWCQSRFELQPVVRLDHLFMENRTSGRTPVVGVATTFWISRGYGVEAELTGAASRVERSYEGWFISYAQGPDLTRQEIERLAPIARRTLGYRPGVGWSTSFVARGDISPRVTVQARVGLSGRRYLETSNYALLSIPDGLDPARVGRDFQPSSERRTRGGLLSGIGIAVALTERFSLTPDVRFVYGGPARVGNRHRELGLGVSALWRL